MVYDGIPSYLVYLLATKIDLLASIILVSFNPRLICQIIKLLAFSLAFL